MFRKHNEATEAVTLRIDKVHYDSTRLLLGLRER